MVNNVQGTEVMMDDVKTGAVAIVTERYVSEVLPGTGSGRLGPHYRNADNLNCVRQKCEKIGREGASVYIQ